MWHRGRYCADGELVPILLLIFGFAYIRGLTAKGADSNQPPTVDDVVTGVYDCIRQSPSAWSEAWRQEYIATIREVVARHPNVPDLTLRMQMFRDGFAPYWAGVPNVDDRSQFEVWREQIRWYTEWEIIGRS